MDERGATGPFARRFALLFVFLLLSLLLYPYAEGTGAGFYAYRVVGAAIVLLTLWAVTFRRGLLMLLLVLAVPSALQHLLFHPQSVGWLPFVNRLLAILFDVVVIAVVASHVYGTAEPDAETIFGALCVYLLFGFMFGSVYAAISAQQPHAFYLTPTLNQHLVPDRFDFVYFSFGTLTELGTPGITAVAPFARSTSLLESIVGILYLAVMISRLINAYQTRGLAKRA